MNTKDGFTCKIQLDKEDGVAFFKIIIDENTNPIDYECIKINSELKRLLQMTDNLIVGKRLTDVKLEFAAENLNLVELLNCVVLINESRSIELYNEFLNIWCKIMAFPINKNYLVLIVSDVTKLKEYQDKVHNLAYYDLLTGLPNRSMLMEKLDSAISKAVNINFNTGGSILFIDIDNLKYINDNFGHSFGDKVINEISTRINSVLTDKYILSRYGGNEFVVLLEDAGTPQKAEAVSNSILKAFDEVLRIDNNELNISCSIGIALYPGNGTTTDELLKNADAAMYKAKLKGKNNCQLYNSNIQNEVFKKINIENNLRNALINNELSLCFQPQFGAKTNKIRGCEALIRWSSPVLGTVPPSSFIPVAEECGLIIPIGEWVLRRSCLINKKWQDELGIFVVMSVNVSVVQLKKKDFVALIRDVLKETKLESKYLEIEITESVLIDSFEHILTVLNDIRELGVRISLDDFGTGYSSLNYLKRLPLDTLKIDKSFVDDITANTLEKAMIGSIISLVHDLELEIVAEGVETTDQINYLLKCNCDTMQGFLLSKPLKDNDIQTFLKSNELTD